MGTVLIAIAVFVIIIIVHEFGHFITAKLFKVPVPEFSIGFGPAIFKKKIGETKYSLRAIPFGGYVQMVGEDEESEDENAFCNKPVWQRIIIVGAGAFLNVLMGFVIYVFLFSGALETPVLKVETLVSNTPAYQILQPGDEIVALNGKRVWYYKDFKFLLNTIDANEELELVVKREGKKQEVKLRPYFNRETQQYNIGIVMKTEKLGFFGKLKYAFYELFFVIKAIFYSFIMLITGGVSIDNISGPVGTVNIISSQIKYGYEAFFSLFALITVNIGIFNLLPIPALDGGRVFFLLVEMVRKKPVSRKMEGIVHFVGLALLMFFMLIVTVNDISSIFLR